MKSSEVSKLIGERWKALPDELKAGYFSRFNALQDAYRAELDVHREKLNKMGQ